MNRGILRTLCAIAAVLLSGSVVLAESPHPTIFSMDFSGFPGGTVLKWLTSKGFVPKQDASNANKVVYFDEDSDLRLATKSHAFGLLLNETDVRGYSRIRIQWGVDVFPPGASYEKGVRAEAVMIYVFFGKDRLSSGSLLIPDSPYFIGLFLCESGPTDHPFTGRYYHAGGRFVCVDRPPAGELVTTEYPIAQAFTRFFDKDQAPDISGFGISIDTNNVKGDGIARAFVRKIEFLK